MIILESDISPARSKKVAKGLVILVSEKSRLNGATLIDSGIRQEMDVIIVAIRTKEGEMRFNPSYQTRIEAGDTLISLGKTNDLEKLTGILSGE